MTHWSGTLRDCQICRKPYGKVMYDARLPGNGWANVCEPCFNRFGSGEGVGKGQRYELQPDGKWLMIKAQNR